MPAARSVLNPFAVRARAVTTRRHDDARRPALQRETSNRRETLWKGATASALGIEMAIAVVIGLLVGRWLDGRFDSEPVWTLVCLCVGIAAGFKGLIRVARQHQRDLAAQADESTAAEAETDARRDDSSTPAS
jgi:ATP synthase protein I